MNKVTLIIDGKEIKTGAGTSILWAALDNGIYIPNLCAMRETHPESSCRLCFVEIEGYPRPVTACTEPVRDGLVISTRGDSALRLARTGLELVLSTHPVNCGQCPANGRCELQKLSRHLGIKLNNKRFARLLPDKPVDRSVPELVYNPNKCVLCGRCVRVCREEAGISAIGFVRRGSRRTVSTAGDLPLGKSICNRCLKCASVCPTGALSRNQVVT